MTRNSIWWLPALALDILAASSAAPAEERQEPSRNDARPVARDSRSVERATPEESWPMLTLRFDVLELRLSSAEIDRIHGPTEAFDIAALAADVIKRGDARVKYCMGRPVKLHSDVTLSAMHSIPYIARNFADSDSDKPVYKIKREELGGVVKLNVGVWGGNVTSGVALAKFNVEFRLLSDSSIELPEHVNVPIISELSQEFAARIRLGEDTYFWSMTTPEAEYDGAGGTLVYVFRVRLDPMTAE